MLSIKTILLSFIRRVDLILKKEYKDYSFGHRCIPSSKFILDDWGDWYSGGGSRSDLSSNHKGGASTTVDPNAPNALNSDTSLTIQPTEIRKHLKLHDYIFYSVAAVLYFIIYLDMRRSDKRLRKQRGDNR
jgi:hypothetical protein